MRAQNEKINRKMKHQLPTISIAETFEDLICDLFNEIENTNTFKKFGKSGHKQKGIDIFSVEKDVAIQCKKKDLTRREISIRQELLNDIEKDVKLIIDQKLKIKISKLFIISTYNDHPDIDEFCEDLKEKYNTSFEIIYWGWQTIEQRISNFSKLLEKYWPNFIIQITSSEQIFQRNLDLRKRIKKDFGDWINYSFENRKRNSKMIIRNFEGTQYPHSNEPDEFNEYSWFGTEINGLDHNGMEFILETKGIYSFDNNTWDFENDSDLSGKFVSVFKIGKINFSDIVDYDTQGDEYYNRAMIFCKFKYLGTPFENYYYVNSNKTYQRFEINEKRN